MQRGIPEKESRKGKPGVLPVFHMRFLVLLVILI
jgi:hypothetical protein